MSQVLHKSLMDIHPRELATLVADVPQLPPSRLELFRRMRDPDATVSEIAELLTQDEVLADKVLQLVSFAFGGGSPEIRTISRAMVILGYRPVRSAALAVGIIEYFRNEGGSGSQWLDFWHHSLAVGAASKVLAHELRFNQPEEAFIGGLLHDVGKLIERLHFADDYQEACTVAQEQHFSWFQCEKALFQVNHATLAAAFFEAWDFPANLVDAVVCHHEPGASQQVPQLAALVHLADIVAHELGHGTPEAWPPGEADPAALLLLGVTMADTAAWHDRIQAEVVQARTILALLA